MNDDFQRIKRLPPYVFNIVNGLKAKASKDGNHVSVTLPESISKKMFKLRLNRFLYQSGLKDDFRLISMLNEGKQGYMIMDR